MHIRSEDQQRPRKNRSGAEKALKRINTAIIVAQLGAFLIVLSQVTIAAGKTIKGDMWFPKEYQLIDSLQARTVNCSSQLVLRVQDFPDVTTVINFGNQGRFLTQIIWEMRLAIVLYGLAMLAGATNKLMFDLNCYSWRYKHLKVNKDLLTATELVLLGFTLKQTVETDRLAEPLQTYFTNCGIDSKNAIQFATPFIAFYVGVSIVLFFHFLTIVMFVMNAMYQDPLDPAEVQARAVAEAVAHLQSVQQAHQQVQQQQQQPQQPQQEQQRGATAVQIVQDGQGSSYVLPQDDLAGGDDGGVAYGDEEYDDGRDDRERDRDGRSPHRRSRKHRSSRR